MRKNVNIFTATTILICTLFCYLQPCFAQQNTQRRVDNGIGVSEPKPFDNRTLTLKLEELDRALASIQVIDSNRLAQSIGLLQGYQTQDVSRSLQVSTLPIPGFKTGSKITVDTDTEGKVKSNEINEESSERKEFSLSPPTLPDLIAASNNNLTTGYDSETLLTKQIDLMYQRFSYQLFLERALSDRLIGDEPRLQAVMGFNIDLSPPEDAKNKAAFVEVTIDKVNGSPNKGTTLVAMMPQEKTYNSFKVSTKSTSFGGAAVAKVFTLGYSERRRGQTFYLYQDADTVTFQKRTNGSKLNETPNFGWEFRPVLGRDSVSSGMRQMFAVVALPNEDKRKIDSDKITVSGSIRTYWRKYNRNSQTTDDKELDERNYSFENVEIPKTSVLQNNLKPKELAIDWFTTDNETAVVTVNGKNLFSGSNVLIGNRVLSNPETGLVFKSDQSLMIKAPLALLAKGDAIINGRYGEAMVLQNDSAKDKGLAINWLAYDVQPSGKLATLNVQLLSRNNDALKLADLPDNPKFLISLGDTALLPFSRIQSFTCPVPQNDGTIKPVDCLLLQAAVPADILKNDTPVTVTIPFQGSKWKYTLPFFNFTNAPLQLARLGGADQSKTTITISGRSFFTNTIKDDKGNVTVHTWRVVLDKIYAPGEGNLTIEQDKLLVLTVPTSTIKDYKNLVILPPYNDAQPVTLAIPGTTPTTPKPKLNENQQAEVEQNNNVGVKFIGENLNAVKDVTLGNISLPFVIGKDNAEITIFLLPPVTATKGRVQLLLKSDNNSPIPATIVIK